MTIDAAFSAADGAPGQNAESHGVIVSVRIVPAPAADPSATVLSETGGGTPVEAIGLALALFLAGGLLLLRRRRSREGERGSAVIPTRPTV